MPFSDWRFTEEFIDIVPVEYLTKVLKTYDKKMSELINSASYTNANGWASILNSFGGKVTFDKLLPFELEHQDKKVNGLNKPMDDTMRALKILFKQSRLPREVLINLAGLGLLQQISE